MGTINQVQGTTVSQFHIVAPESCVLVNQDEYKRFLDFIQKDKAINIPLEVMTIVTHQANIIATNFIPNTQLEGKLANNVSCLANCDFTWILDSGATHHISCKEGILTNSKRVKGAYVALLNGNKIEITHTSTICLSTKLVLQGALCVPAFHYNLISVGELVKNSKYKVILYSNQCIIQDQHRKGDDWYGWT